MAGPKVPQRAVDLGFDPRPWFHGTTGDVRAFRPEYGGLGAGGQDSRRATFLTRSPRVASSYALEGTPREELDLAALLERYAATGDASLLDQIDAAEVARDKMIGQTDAEMRAMRELAQTLSRRASEAFDAGKWDDGVELQNQADMLKERIVLGPFASGANVMPLTVRGNYLRVEPFDSIPPVPGIDTLVAEGKHKGFYDSDLYQALFDRAQREGYDGVEFVRVSDGGPVAADTLAVFDPKNIRSVNAEFDPSRLNDNDLMALYRRKDAPAALREQALQALRQRSAAAAVSNVTQGARGSTEALGTFLSGIVAQPVSGLAGGLAGLIEGVRSGSLDRARQAAAGVQEDLAGRLTYIPRSAAGQDALAQFGESWAGEALDAYSSALDSAGTDVAETTGSPALGAAVRAGLEMLDPSSLIPGAKGLGGTVSYMTKQGRDRLLKDLRAGKSAAEISLPRSTADVSGAVTRGEPLLAVSGELAGRPQAENNAANIELLRRLADRFGLENVDAARGVYGGSPELSFVVRPDAENLAAAMRDVAALGREFGQDSVLTPQGLNYTRGGLEREARAAPFAPERPLVEGDIYGRGHFPNDAVDFDKLGEPITLSDFYTEVNEGNPFRFGYQLDFNREVPSLLQGAQTTQFGGVHWSTDPNLQTLDPEFYGTGAAGAERARIAGGGLPRAFVYQQDNMRGPPVRPEPTVAAVAPYPYAVQAPGLYDLGADPNAVGVSPMLSDPNVQERLLRDFGARGIRTPEPLVPGSQGTLALFDRQNVAPWGQEPTPRGVGLSADAADVAPVRGGLLGILDASQAPRTIQRAGDTAMRPFTRPSYAPGIYDAPREAVKRALAIYKSESPALQELFGVSRRDLDDSLIENSAAMRAVFPDYNPLPAKNFRSAAEQEAPKLISTERNADRLAAASALMAEAAPGTAGWYNMKPLFDEYVKILGPERARAQFQQDMWLQANFSGRTPVSKEIERQLLARYLIQQGDPAAMALFGARGSGFGGTTFPGQVKSMLEMLDDPASRPRPAKGADALKQPIYMGNALGQIDLSVHDKHDAVSMGLADARHKLGGPNIDKKGEDINLHNPSGPEYAALFPFDAEIAKRAGMPAAAVQATRWFAFAPDTGVVSLGGPKLEEYARIVDRIAKQNKIAPRDALERLILGELPPYLRDPRAR